MIDYRQLATDLARTAAYLNNLSALVLADSRDEYESGEVRESTKPAGRSNAEVTDNSRGAQFISEPEQPYPLGGFESAEVSYGG